MSGIWAIILAAGESKRMGSPKMLLTFEGKTMIEKVIENVSESKVSKILVVLGAFREPLAHALNRSDVRCCYNDNYKDGMLSSVICGFRNLPSNHNAVMVFQGDQPLIKPAVINTIIEAYLSSKRGIVIPVHNKRRGHPILIDRKYRTEIEKLCPAKGLRSLAQKFYDDVFEIETEEPGILRDFDTCDEYMKEINKIK